MPGFGRQRKLFIVGELRKLRREKRMKNERLTYQDVEATIWSLPQTRTKKFFDWLHEYLSKSKKV